MKKIFRAAAVAAAALLSLAVCACTGGGPNNGFVENQGKEDGQYGTFENAQTGSETFYAMGTSAALMAMYEKGEKQSFDELKAQVGRLLYGAEDSLSALIKGSSISDFNEAEAGAKVEIDATAFTVLSTAKRMYEFTGGYYNPAVYHSVQAFGFPLGANTPNLPSEEEVNAFCELASHFNELQLVEENSKFYAIKPEYTVTVGGESYSLAVDLGGIGKGWCADRVDEILTERKFEYGYFSFGSSSMAVKRYYKNDSKSYSIIPRDPRDDFDDLCSVWIKDVNLSTSGDYEQYYELKNDDGTKTRYCHIINPMTGAPIRTGVASVTVIGGSAAEDDAITTALSCMDKATAVNFINDKLSDKTVIMLVFEGDKGIIISNRPDDLNKINSKYTLGNKVENGRIVLNDVA